MVTAPIEQLPRVGFLPYVHSFRAVAIAIIVAGHTIAVFHWPSDSITRGALEEVFQNGTVLFVFVAGFLFEHLSAKYSYGRYLGRKLRYVVLPFLLTSLPSVIYAAMTSWSDQYPELAGTSVPYRLGWYLVNSGAGPVSGAWFIPMITTFYLLAPVFIRIVRHPRLYWVLALLVPLSLLAHRTVEPYLHFGIRQGVYLLSAYVAGMWVSHNREKVERVLARAWPWLLGGFGVMTALMIIFRTHHGNYDGAYLFSREHGLVDWLFAQKLLLTFALLGVLRRYEDRLARPLHLLGDVSFTVFFIHVYVLILIEFAIERTAAHFVVAPPADLLSWLLVFCVALALSTALTVAGRRVVGRRSRYLIGS